MESTREALVIGAESAKVSPYSSQLESAGSSLASMSPSAPSVPEEEALVNGDTLLDKDLIVDVRPRIKKLVETVRTFCRTPERERRIELLALIREEARRLRNTLSAANFEALATLTFALERLFTALSKDLAALNSSTLKTVCYAMDFLCRRPRLTQAMLRWSRCPSKCSQWTMTLSVCAR